LILISIALNNYTPRARRFDHLASGGFWLRVRRMLVKSRVYIAAGFVCVALGVIGIPLPLLPTTPFLLLAAYFFARGSERWHRWLMTHPALSPYILAFRDKRGLTRGQKWRIAGLVTLTLIITGAFAPFYGKALAAFIWVTSLLFLYFTPTAESN
jgi:uncharacterized membrane protein YbaN (DUF454 family)